MFAAPLALSATLPPLERLQPHIARRLPFAFARAHGILLAVQHETHYQAWVHPESNLAVLAEVQREYGPLALQQLAAEEWQQALQQAYEGQEDSAASVVENVESDLDLSRLLQEIPEVEDLLETADDAPIIRMLNALLTEAAREGASDIHIEPFETHSVVRFRVDGMLRDIVRPKRALHAALISRLKIMASLDIAEKRLPQDGRITLRIGGRAIDVRVSTLPVGNVQQQSERAVLRLLEKSREMLSLTHLGMHDDTLQKIDDLVRQPHGIILVTGPTGSGKTTTLYAMLQRLDATVSNIMTVEDPIEYELPGIGQTQVNPKIDLTFAKTLRAILRQDPDVVMIGEIRDLETAQIAVQASLTGHLVLATLHTNDAPSAITRMVDMGIEPFLLASSLLGVLSQRLVRKLCIECKRQDAHGNWHAPGCDACNHTGYQGRTGIHELLGVTESLRDLIHERAAESAIRQLALQQGMRSLRDDGMRWVQTGLTSEAEVVRVTRD
ncbi:type II secretion system ATPase GspE [Parvibium lacunae]|uniref:Type II secretion system protein E n=1 Tax=Parvibium lacunae TaxID=1888893 RepID=A0A368KZS7_9BURK|nr:type II secretion system ATPase GspE [Parvibium lacunae]RCS56808.1 type II secretion system protein GspE [Parvibium lacunae]